MHWKASPCLLLSSISYSSTSIALNPNPNPPPPTPLSNPFSFFLRPTSYVLILQDAAQEITEEISDLLLNLFLPDGYDVLLTGHSLGGGTAALLGLMLREKIKVRVYMYVCPCVYISI